ncbi:hypothetical protein RRG08_013489 [Elysia crispata]|nr:hypothetical protein RRG08_013489 [Elysia crispata]
MMSTAVNSLKEQSKRAMTKISGLTDNEDKKSGSFKPTGGVIHNKHGKYRPTSTDEAGQKSERPPRPPPPSSRSKRDSLNRPQSATVRNTLGHSSEKDESHDDSQLRLSYHTMDMSLMGDSDIQAAMLRSASAEVLPSEGSMGSSSTPSSVSLEETDSANIPFGALNSSDEGLSMLAASDQDSVSQRASSKEESLSAPVAPPRTKRKSPNPSPMASPYVSANRARPNATSTPVAPHIPGPPRPLPRQSSLRLAETQQMDSRATATVQDAPLIKFDSSESGTPDSDLFDPLASGKPRSVVDDVRSAGEDSQYPEENGDEVDGQPLQRNRDSRSSLSRAKAFRRESPAVPLRPAYKDDSPEHSLSTSTPKREPRQDLFDPLSDIAGVSTSDNGGTTDVQEQDHKAEERRRKSSQLLQHEWSLDSLASMTLPSNPARMRNATNNPFLIGNQLASQPHSNYYSLAYAGSGPLPPPGRLPTSFLAPFDQTRSSMPLPGPSTQTRSSVLQPAPAGSTMQGTLSSLPGSSPFGNSSYKLPIPARAQSQNLNPNPFTSASGRLLPAPIPSSTSTSARRTLPTAPGTGISASAVTSPNSSNRPAASTKSQADLLSDLIGINFGGGSQQPAHPPTQRQQQQQQQPTATTQPPASSQSQPRWETFD